MKHIDPFIARLKPKYSTVMHALCALIILFPYTSNAIVTATYISELPDVSRNFDSETLSDYLKLRSSILKMENELKTTICANFDPDLLLPVPILNGKTGIWDEKIIDRCAGELILSARICKGASKKKKKIILRKFPKLKIDLVETRNYWSVPRPYGGRFDYLHVFLQVKDYFSKDNHLYIDPTITQHYLSDENLPVILKLPKIFVGSYEEIQKVFKDHGIKYSWY